MFAKICASSLLVSALCLQVTAHVFIAPGLGVTGTPSRNDVKRPSDKQPCGNVGNISSLVPNSNTVTVVGNTVKVKAIGFNGGKDGGREVVKAGVDITGEGKIFQDVNVTENGNPNPPGAGSDDIEVVLPAGTKCPKSGCILSFTTIGGFGNCVVAVQDSNGKENGTVRASGAGNSGLSNAGGNGGGKGGKGGNSAACSTIQLNPGSTTGSAVTGSASTQTPTVNGRYMARLLADLEKRGEGAVEIAKRGT